MIYADYNATGPLYPEVLEAMVPWLEGRFGNASSVHYPLGAQAARAVDRAREQVATLIECDPEQVVFTSGGTESCFLALVGAASAAKKIIITSGAEHAAVREVVDFLARSPYAAQLLELPLSRSGDLELESLNDTPLAGIAAVSVMSANNETGVRFDLSRVGMFCSTAGALLHTDAVQVVGREQFSALHHPADLISMSGHKFGGPKGIGALIVKSSARWKSPMPGGGQEGGRRGGTAPVAQIVGLGTAAAVAFKQLREGYATRIAAIRDQFEKTVVENFPKLEILGKDCNRLSNTSSLLIPGSIALDLVSRLGKRGICISAGSACSVSDAAPSRVLTAMALSTFDALATVRVSFGTLSTHGDAQAIAEAIVEEVAAQREDAEVLLQSKKHNRNR